MFEILKPVLSYKSRIYLFMLVLLQIAFIDAYLPVGEWFTSGAIYSDDFSFHYADALTKGRYFKEYMMLYGYTPYMRAGTICNILFSVDNFGWALFVYMFSFLGTGVAYKLYFVIMLLSLPFVLYWSACNFRLSKQERILCAVLGTLFLHVSVCVNFLSWGSASYLLSCYLSILIASFSYRYFVHQKISDIVLLILFFSFGLWCHVYTIVHVSVPFILGYCFYFRKLSLKQHGIIIASNAFVLLVSAPWLIPYFVFLPEFLSAPRANIFYVTSSLLEPLKTYFFFDPKFNEYRNMVFPKNGVVDLLLLVSGILGIIKWGKEKRMAMCCMFAVSVCFFFFLGYYGSFFHLTASATPLRFVVFMNVLLTIPSSVGLIYLYGKFLGDRSLKTKVITFSVILSLSATILAGPYYFLFWKKSFRLITHVPEQIEELTEWVKENTTAGGRILIENSDFESDHQYYGTHLVYLFPLMTGREFIGNYSFYAASRDAFCSFANGMLFQKPIKNYTPEEANAYIALYNIKWIVVWSDASREFFKNEAGYYSFRKKIDRFYIFEAKRSGNFFIKGTGKVKADLNRIELSDLAPEDGKIIISYHWMKYLRTESETLMTKTKLFHDPVGFITLQQPPERVVIYNSYSALFLDFPKIIYDFMRNVF